MSDSQIKKFITKTEYGIIVDNSSEIETYIIKEYGAKRIELEKDELAQAEQIVRLNYDFDYPFNFIGYTIEIVESKKKIGRCTVIIEKNSHWVYCSYFSKNNVMNQGFLIVKEIYEKFM